MPKFILKHGCCYIAPVDSDSTLTCEVFENLEFDRVSPSDAHCREGQSSPEFSTPQYPKTISWADQNTEKGENSTTLATEIDENDENKTIDYNFGETVHKRELQIDETFHDHTSFVTLYGKNTFDDARYESEKELEQITEDSSVYRPTTKRIPENEISNSDKFLDCLTVCLWRCTSWCQRVN